MICGATHDLGCYLDSADEDDRREGMAEDILDEMRSNFDRAAEVADHYGVDADMFFDALNGQAEYAGMDAEEMFREYLQEEAFAEADRRGRDSGYRINDDYSRDDDDD